MATIDYSVEPSIPIAELPAPVLFHPLKHHLGYIQSFIHVQSQLPTSSVKLALLRIGTSQLDFYTGSLSPMQIATEVILYLQQHDLLKPEAYYSYLTATGSHYRTITLSDATDWVLRWGIIAGRYVHLHPARYTAQTIRVKATSLRTAIAATIAAKQSGIVATDIRLINEVRKEWLSLPPLTVLDQHEGAGKLIALLNKL